jgi:hypothetical protein
MSKMTYTEYKTKLDMIAVSGAPYSVKEAAILKLNKQYRNDSADVAKQQLIESSSDKDDIGGHD